jgi:uncharacterized protein
MFNEKRLLDSVHGSIGLSKLELAIINTQSFQRLRNIKQLGLVHFVYPGADYSRFSHSIGVCNLTGKILDAYRQKGIEISGTDVQKYRLAGLLHDIGHYPFSHAMEHALAKAFPKADQLLESPEQSVIKSFINHEKVGKEILLNDVELNSIVKDLCDPSEIYKIFLREKSLAYTAANEPPEEDLKESPIDFSNLVSSDLDADRLDYLLRTAHHTGLPYGKVDVDYIITQMNLDSDRMICLNPKALKAADHMLLSRYFDYQQVSYHKTVAAFESILQDVLIGFLKNGWINCSREDIIKMVTSGAWAGFDDAFIFNFIKFYKEENKIKDDNLNHKVDALIKRKPPKLIYSDEKLILNDDQDIKNVRYKKHILNSKIKEYSERFGIDESKWFTWDVTQNLTKVGSLVPFNPYSFRTPDWEDKYEQAIKIYDNSSGKSVPIMRVPQSLMHVLANYVLTVLRLYVLHEDPSKIEEIRRYIKTDIDSI